MLKAPLMFHRGQTLACILASVEDGNGVVVSFLSRDKTPKKIGLEEERFLLAHSGSELDCLLGLGWMAPVALGLCGVSTA